MGPTSEQMGHHSGWALPPLVPYLLARSYLVVLSLTFVIIVFEPDCTTQRTTVLPCDSSSFERVRNHVEVLCRVMLRSLHSAAQKRAHHPASRSSSCASRFSPLVERPKDG